MEDALSRSHLRTEGLQKELSNLENLIQENKESLGGCCEPLNESS